MMVSTVCHVSYLDITLQALTSQWHAVGLFTTRDVVPGTFQVGKNALDQVIICAEAWIFKIMMSRRNPGEIGLLIRFEYCRATLLFQISST